MTRPRPLIAGNWKMFGRRAELAEIDALAERLGRATASVDVAICPPATIVGAAVDRAAGRIAIGGQDCHSAVEGAHTGDISATMLADLGSRYVIVGHSERRQAHGETDAMVSAKMKAATNAGLHVIVCVGETLAEREGGRAVPVVEQQIAQSIPEDATDTLAVAYEPVWAIGTGLTPTAEQIAEIHREIRARLVARFGAAGQGVRILYGGSVKPANAAEIFAVENVDGALVGGASLKAADFSAIILAHPAAGV